MKDYIAVAKNVLELKRLLFLFDRVGIMGLEDFLELLTLPQEGIDISSLEQFHDELMELIEKRIIFEPFLAETGSLPESKLKELVPSGESLSEYEKELSENLEKTDQRMLPLILKSMMLRSKKGGQKIDLFQSFPIPEDLSDIEGRLNDSHKRRRDLEMRLIAARMRGLGHEAYPIVEFSDYPDFATATSKSTVIEVLLSGIPMPGDDISFGRLLEFRDDTKSRRLLLALRRWVRKISNEQLSPAELSDEIEWQICENREHMRLHKLRAKNTLWKIVLKCPLDIFENLMRIKLTKSIDAIFEAREVNVSLLAEELNAPGRELSYIAKVREDFR